MPQLQKLSKGSSFRGGREVISLGSGRTAAAIAVATSSTFTFTIKEDTWINKLICVADDGAAAPVDMSLSSSVSSIIHNNTQMLSGLSVPMQMHGPLATNNPGLGFWVRTGDVLQVTVNNDQGVGGTATFYTLAFTSI